jgi:tetratricopeptide (TPR) repeat protein
LAASYKTATQDKSQAEAIKLAQKQWMRVRSNCTDIACIRTVYSDRISELKKGSLPSDDLNTCNGDAKRSLDLAAAADSQVSDDARKTKYGRINDGTLNFGGAFLRPDISLMYAKIHCWKAAQEMIGKIVQENSQEENSQESSKANLSIEYAKAGQFGAAIALLDSLKSEEASSASAYGIAEALVVADRNDQAKEVIMRVTTRENFMESPSFWLIKTLIDAGRVSEAEKMIGEVNAGWNEHLLLAAAYMKAGKKNIAESHIQKALGFTGNAPSEAGADTSVKPDEDSAADTRDTTLEDHIRGWAATIYIDGREFSKAYKSASAITWKLRKLQALLRIAEAEHRAGNLRESEEMYTEALQVMNHIDGEDKASQQESACGFITQSYGKTGNVEKVISTPPTYCPGMAGATVTYGYAVDELANSGNIEGALRVQTKINPLFRNAADAPIAAAFARKGEYEAATAKVHGILNPFIRANTVRRMASVTPPPKVVADWLEDALTIKGDDMQAAAVQTLTAALARSRNSAVALSWLDRQPTSLVKARGYLGVAQGLLGIVPGTGTPRD